MTLLADKCATMPVTPHIPGGLVRPEQLRQIAETAEKFGGSLKIIDGGIAIMGLSPADGEKALGALGARPESFRSKSVRAVHICPGNPHCPMAQQACTELGLALDSEFFGQEVPGKIRIAVSGCPNCCAGVFAKDIGLYGTAKGYVLAVGGNAGRQAAVAQVVAQHIPATEVAPIIRGILALLRQHGQPKERLGKTIDRIGWDRFIAETIPAAFRT